MWRNYLVVALRNLWHNKLYSAINIAGLAIGLAAGVLILLFVRYELSYDRWLPNYERIVRLHTGYHEPDRPPFVTVRSAGRMRAQVESLAPDLIETSTRLLQLSATIVRDGIGFDDTISFVDQSFFDVFDLPLIAGTKEAALADPSAMAVTESTAIRYFGRTDVVGETLEVCCLEGRRLEIRIAAVIADLPKATHLDISMLMPIEEEMFSFAPNLFETWTSVNVFTYFVLRDGVHPREVEDRIWDWVDTESPFLDDAPPIPQGRRLSEFVHHTLMPVPDIHLDARQQGGSIGDMKPLGDARLVSALSGVALLILGIAAINFTNLATARAVCRAREVGLRKTLGASRPAIAAQFLGEAVLTALLALALALALVELALPLFNHALDRALSFDWSDLSLLGPLLLATLAVGAASGLHPALLVSRYRPSEVLHGSRSGEGGGAGRLRNALVVVQFAAAIGLIVCTAVTWRQTLFARAFDTGLTVEHRLALRNIGRAESAGHRDAIRNALLALPEIEAVTFSSDVPSEDSENNTGVQILGAGAGEPKVINYYSVDHGWFEAYGVAPVAGRLFEEARPADTVRPPADDGASGSGSLVLNVAATRQLGFATPQEAVGQTARIDMFRMGPVDFTIVGVVPDLYFRSIRFGVRPSMYFRRTDSFRTATLVTRAGDMAALAQEVERVWREIVPSVPFALEFVDELVARQYAEDAAQGRLFAAFSGLAILVACLGLYGLAAYATERRTREIGIRKVMGATARDIVRLFAWQFTRPVLVANAVAWPVAGWLMYRWLESFEYRIGLSPAPFLLAGFATLLIAWITVAGHAMRIARTHPAVALREE